MRMALFYLSLSFILYLCLPYLSVYWSLFVWTWRAVSHSSV